MGDSLTVGGGTGLGTVALRPVTREPQVESRAQVQSGETAEPAAPVAPRTTSRTEIDPETQSVVFRVVNESSGAVVTQIPSDVQLRVREYVATAEASRQPDLPGGRKA